MRQLDHDQLLYLLGLHRLREWQPSLLQYPVIVLLVAPLLGAQQISRSQKGHKKLVFHGIYAAVGCKRAVGHEEGVLGTQSIQSLLLHDLRKPLEHHDLIDHAVYDPARSIPVGPEVLRISPLPSLLANSQSPEILLHCAICRIQGRMGCNHPDSQVLEIITPQDLQNLAAIYQVRAPQNNQICPAYSYPNLSMALPPCSGKGANPWPHPSSSSFSHP